ncbi:pseudouridine-5'-phosphatase [Tetranychus urticae]|uniref:pseudouridine 5'-phosphatase n=1 Tax=Tetranychus urticae TaxID=32264 RepID=T1KD28_TETUR|nr:pseudouridine-5'-phosphatase [Tetranychus urticae]
MASSTSFKPVTHVIFDLDGLLLDTETLYFKAINQVVSKFGKEYTPEIKVKTMGKTGKDAAQTVIDALQLPINADEATKLLEPIYSEAFQNVQFMPGALRLLEHLKKHSIPMAIATSSSAYSFGVKIAKHKDVFETDKYFHHIVKAAVDPEIKFGKPHPETFLVCAKRFNPPANPSDVLVFEDSINGVKGALAAGMQCVQVPDPMILKWNNVEPTMIINSLNDFKPELFGLPPFED